jgi:hypothetical protein
VLILLLLKCVLGLTVSFAESLWHCDFVEVPKCSFAKITAAHVIS